MAQGKFITIEGTEGAGKSTVLNYIQDYLRKIKKDILLTREPGGTEVAEEIRRVLLHKVNEKMQPDTELLLMFASRAQHLRQCILPALAEGKWVISDRFVDASYAYQGGGRGMNRQSIETLDKLVVGSHYPDLTLLLDVPADLGMMRAEKREIEKDRIEQEHIDFFGRVRDAYLVRAKEDPKRIKIVDASQPLDLVQAQIGTILNEFVTEKTT